MISDFASADEAPLVGLLALQGDYDAHRRILEELGARTRLVRAPRDLSGLDGLLIPGGESTVMSRLCARYALQTPLQREIEGGLPTLGTCAGLIFLARRIEGGSSNFEQTTLGVLNVAVERNAYGAQLESFESDVWVEELGQSVRGVFIRAPRISAVGEGVDTLARYGDAPVLVRQGDIVALSFHPEIAGERRIHALWLDLVKKKRKATR